MKKRIGLVMAMLALLTGCGGASKSSPSPTYGGGGTATQGYAEPSAPPSGGRFNAEESVSKAPAQPAPASVSAGADSSHGESRTAPRDREPVGRQGLGTEWGETRTSRIHDVAFVRADGSRPFAVTTLHYNDARGVDQLANLHASRESRARSVSAASGAITVSIRDSSGDPFEALKVGERTFVIGRAGERYTIVLQNVTSHRFESVATVDGLDVINGKPGNLDNRGYVLMPFATLEIDGFRQSTQSVAAFRFGAIGDSYAAKTGDARNVGVIGVAFFAERGDTFVNERDLRLRDSANPFPQSDPRFAQPPRN
jgi:hypothetical protein